MAKRKAAAAPEDAGPSEPREVEPKRETAAERAAKRRRIKEFHVAWQPGDIFTWGSGEVSGALGLGPDTDDQQNTTKLRPTLVDLAGVQAVQVECGGMHTAALTDAGVVLTWGVNDEGALGRPTPGTAWEGDAGANKHDPMSPGAARLPDGVRAVQIAAGDGFTLALDEQGALWGWGCFKPETSGREGFYVHGQGVERLARLPVRVYAPEGVRDRGRKLTAGSRHAALLTRRGTVLTFGMGGQGQLGRVAEHTEHAQPPLEELLRPAPVAGLGDDVCDVACGAHSTFAITRRGGRVLAWGLNNQGQLGLPLGDADSAAAQFVWEPTAVDALRGVASVVSGDAHTLVLTRQHAVLSFGSPMYGALGRSDVAELANGTDVRGDPAPRPVDALEGLAEGDAPAGVAANATVSGIVTAKGEAYLFGSNTNNQLAKGGDDEDSVTPTRVRRTKAFGKRRILQLSIGGQHAALLAAPAEEEAEANGAAAAPAAAPQ